MILIKITWRERCRIRRCILFQQTCLYIQVYLEGQKNYLCFQFCLVLFYCENFPLITESYFYQTSSYIIIPNQLARYTVNPHCTRKYLDKFCLTDNTTIISFGRFDKSFRIKVKGLHLSDPPDKIEITWGGTLRCAAVPLYKV